MDKNNIVKSKNDKRLYRYVILKNKMQVVLISDKKTKTSACSLNVNVGHQSDPEDSNGLAHFLEHMLFMGTKKYNDEDYFMYFINKHGGSTNAYTALNRTNYYFELASKYFEKGLDIFSQFFIEPLFKKEAVKREINAVHSEHSKNKNSDMWRFYQIVKTISKDEHPFSKFGTGSRITLDKPNIRDKLVDFYNRFYSANIMTLVVYSNTDLDSLERLVVKKFGKIKNKDIKKPFYPGKPLKITTCNTTVCQRLVKMASISNEDRINIIWQTPSIKKYFKVKPLDLIANLLDHSGEGTFNYKLNELGLIVDVDTSVLEECDDCTLIVTSIKITDKGFDSLDTILTMLQKYLIKIKKEFDQFFYDENRKIAQLNFDYRDSIDPIDYVSLLQENFNYYPIKYLLYGTYYYKPYSRKVLERLHNFFSYIDLRKSVVIISSKKYKGRLDKLEKHYSIEYSIKNQPKLKQLSVKNKITFNFPKKNEFIPDDVKLVKLVKLDKTKPKKISNSKDFEIWYQYGGFKVPTVLCTIAFYSDDIYSSVSNYVKTNMFFRLLNYKLRSLTYYAWICGNFYLISSGQEYFTIEIRAYSSVLKNLLSSIFNNFLELKFTLKDFEHIKNEYIENLENSIYDSQINLISRYSMEKINDVFYTDKEQLDVLKLVNIDDITKPKYNYIKAVINGNIKPKTAINILKSTGLLNITKPSKITMVNKLDPMLKGEEQIFIRKNFNDTEPDSAIKISYEVGQIIKNKTRNWKYYLANLFIINNTVSNRFFDTMRTKGSTGYIVKASIEQYGSVQSPTLNFSFYIQSPNKHPIKLRKSIKNFIKNHETYLKNMTKQDFEKYKTSMIHRFQKPHQNILELHSLLVNEVLSGTYIFDYKKKVSSEMKNLKKSDVINFFHKYLVNKNSRMVRVFELYNRKLI